MSTEHLHPDHHLEHEHHHEHEHDHNHDPHGHYHIADNGTVYYHTHEENEVVQLPEHTHSDGVVHSHTHVHDNSKAVVNRLSRAIGHLESVKRMVEDHRDSAEVLIQLAAVRSALSSTAKVILKDHMEHCINDGVDTAEQLAALNNAIDKFM